jgi:hypothetical protein
MPAVVDRQYPSILIDLCRAHRRGEDCMYALHDALCEIGYHNTAAWHFASESSSCFPRRPCVVVARVIGGKSIDDIEDYSQQVIGRPDTTQT